MFGSDDDTDFIPSMNSNSKLASLFGGVPSRDDGDTTFTFAAPKQPKKGVLKDDSRQASPNKQASAQQVTETSVPSVPTSSSSTNKLSIIIVKAVHTYKLQDGQYVAQGKLGAAILGNSTVHVYQLLLYKGKQQHMASARITPEFQLSVQSNKYSTFYNDKGENWSLHFEDEVDGQEFAREICLARAASACGAGEIKTLVTQVLSLAADNDGQFASVGDAMEIFYTVHVYSAGKLTQLVESNMDAAKPQRVKIRKNVWEEGLIGVAKGTKVLILLPPTVVHPWKSEVNGDVSLAVEVFASRLKQVRKSPPILPTRLPSIGQHSAESSADEQSVRARVASISEALTGSSDKPSRASIISRMARMGQATLPLGGRNRSDSEETGDDSSIASSAKSKPFKSRSAKSRPIAAQPSPSIERCSSSTVTPGPSQMALYQPVPVGWPHAQPQPYSMAGYGVGQYPMPDGGYPLHAAPSTHGSPAGTPSSADMSVFLSETRAHNTEVRMAVTKVADKVDTVLSKLDQVQGHRPPQLGPLLDSSTLLASVQKIVTENEQLQSELADKRGKLDVQNDRIYQLLNTSHRYLEQSNATTTDNDSVVAALRQEKARLAEQLAHAETQLLEVRRATEREAEENARLASVVEAQRKELEGKSSCVEEELKKTASLASVVDAQQMEIETQKRVLAEVQTACGNMAGALERQETELTEKRCRIAEQDADIEALRARLKESEDASGVQRRAVAELEGTMHDLQAFKEDLEKNVAVTTERLKSENADAEGHIDSLKAKYLSQIRSLEVESNVLKSQIEALKATSELPSLDLVNVEVKRVMNGVWKCLQMEFAPGESYVGEDIRRTIMTTIRDITCQVAELQLTRPVSTAASEGKPASRAGDGAGKTSNVVQERSGNEPAAMLVEQEATLKTEEDVLPSTNIVDSSSRTGNEADTPIVSSVLNAKEVEPLEYNNVGEKKSVLPAVKEAVTTEVSSVLNAKEVEPLEYSNVGEKKQVLPAVKETVKTEVDVKNNSPVPLVKTEEPEVWRPQPPPPPLFDDDDDEEDSWLS